MNIISASRRTDIPAFHADWLMNRLRAGYAVYANPFSHKPCTVSLRPEDVHSLVFWTKDFRPLLPHLDELDQRGYAFTVHYTITGAPELYEPHVPSAEESVRVFRQLAKRYSPWHLAWRFDPILASSLTPLESWEERFSLLAEMLAGATSRCVTSFACFYGKVLRNLDKLKAEHGIVCRDPSLEEKKGLLLRLADIAAKHGMEIFSCCNAATATGKIKPSKCIDGELLAKFFPHKPPILKSNATRQECGCTISRDIGAYGTCRHGCIYCYANTSQEQVERSQRLLDPESESLLPIIDATDSSRA